MPARMPADRNCANNAFTPPGLRDLTGDQVFVVSGFDTGNLAQRLAVDRKQLSGILKAVRPSSSMISMLMSREPGVVSARRARIDMTEVTA